MKGGAVKLYRLKTAKTVFFLCDMQEKLKPAIPLFNSAVENITKMLSAAKIIGMPLIVTEQYPKGLGKTVKELDISHACAVIPKTKFSMIVDPMKTKMIEGFGGKPKTVVLCGVEAHICIEQTAMDLIANNVDVWLVADCVASRLNQDRDLAIERMRDIGCVITTSESVIYNMLCNKDNPSFKEVAALVREKSADMQFWRPMPSMPK